MGCTADTESEGDGDSTPSAWYRDGLRFTCTRCGACCTGAPGYVWVNQEELVQIAEFRGQSVADFAREHVRQVGLSLSLVEKPNGDCVFYDRDRRACTIYAVRPRQCRSWPFWQSNVRSPESWAQTCQVCPGAGKGEFLPCEEIVRRASLIRL